MVLANRHIIATTSLFSYLDKIDFIEGLNVPRFLDVEDGNNVLVVEVSEKLHLSQRSQAEHGVVERCDLLDGHLLARRLVYRRTMHLLFSVAHFF